MHDREQIDAQLKRMFFWLREAPYTPPIVVEQDSEEDASDEDIIETIASEHND